MVEERERAHWPNHTSFGGEATEEASCGMKGTGGREKRKFLGTTNILVRMTSKQEVQAPPTSRTGTVDREKRKNTRGGGGSTRRWVNTWYACTCTGA